MTQLGVFAVVVVVFKFMLNRQDVKDAAQDEKDAENVTILRAELARERTEHNDTRNQLYALLDSLTTKEVTNDGIKKQPVRR